MLEVAYRRFEKLHKADTAGSSLEK